MVNKQRQSLRQGSERAAQAARKPPVAFLLEVWTARPIIGEVICCHHFVRKYKDVSVFTWLPEQYSHSRQKWNTYQGIPWYI